MTLIKILGIGSPFADDQLGWKAIDLIQQKKITLQHSRQVALQKLDRPGINLLAIMNNATAVFLIDAVKTGAPIGTLHRLENEEIEKATLPLSSHSMGIGEAIKLGRQLEILPKDIILYGLEIDFTVPHFNFSIGILCKLKLLVNALCTELTTKYLPPYH